MNASLNPSALQFNLEQRLSYDGVAAPAHLGRFDRGHNDDGSAYPRVGNVPQRLAPTEGTATVYRLRDGSRVLRFTNFKTSNGPDVHVYMVAADDAKDHATVLQSDFSVIKGNIGDQNYTLGPDVDLSKYRTVVRCKRFPVNFGAAPLTPDHALSRMWHEFSTWRAVMPSDQPSEN